MQRAYRCAQPIAIILVGPPGSGKGTQAAQISPALGIPAISTGEMLRRECHSGSPLGKAVEAVLASGQLVSDDLMNQVIASRLRETDCENGFILDGYPRTASQARFLSRLLAKLHILNPVVFHFDIANEDIVNRLTRRLQCAECGRIFSMSNVASGETVCDRDGSKLLHRADDNATSIRERLRVYEENATQLIRYYRKRGYHRICASRAAEEISRELLAILGSQPALSALPQRAKAAAQLSYV
jgi:adenylate kinase